MSNRLKTVIVDDERLARRELWLMLSQYQSIQVVGEAESVQQAVELIQHENPDLIFLDIQMQGETGFDLLEKAPGAYKVVFVTAFDSYALRAFEVNALDYLLKPINPSRLDQAIERLSKLHSQKPLFARKLSYDDRIFLEVNARSKFIKVSSIVYIQAAADYCEIYTTDGAKLLLLKPLKEWEERLPEQNFVRIHRSTIVNLDYVKHLEISPYSSGLVYISNLSEPLVMSRRYAAKLKLKFG
ncbi:MAG: response regulator transcription factor [Blastocatellia bacterium]|nr:response regulator transcription factor [Blastocatellia bacterium]